MQAQTPEVSAEKATTPDELRLVSVEQLKKIHRDLDACQKVIWLAGCRPRGYGFDPSYVTDAQERLKEIETLLAEPAPAQDEQHFDDRAVDRFAAAMKLKLAAARAKGRRGWDNHLRVSDRAMAKMLIEHLTKGNAGTFEDVANFAMMLHQRGADPKVLADAFSHFAQTEQQPIYQIRPRENVRDWCDVNVDGYRAAQAMASMETRKLYVAPVSQPAQVTAAMWKAAHDSMESDGDLALALQEALNSAPVAQTELVEALREAERFIDGFEGCELQEGIDELLMRIRAAQSELGGSHA